jgi:hypothetical protein
VADFRTHLIGGSIVCAVASLGSYSQGLSSALETQGLFALGTAASLLPDIDADDSRPLRTVFDVAGIFVGFLVAFRFAAHLKPLELAGIWAGTWLIVRWPLRFVFARFTVHRGIWHTLLMAAVLALAAAVASDLLLGVTPRLAWLIAGFLLLGYVTHLVLDEAASVDLLGRRVKRSFGTALKPISLRFWPGTLVLLGLAVVLIGLAPDPNALLGLVAQLGIETAGWAAHWPRW